MHNFSTPPINKSGPDWSKIVGLSDRGLCAKCDTTESMQHIDDDYDDDDDDESNLNTA